MKALETKVDPTAHDVKEILATKFVVEPSFLEQIHETWARQFIPTNVSVELYKIHFYSPDEHFKSYCDMPEAGLVSTFLVGLGDLADNWNPKCGNFYIGREKLR